MIGHFDVVITERLRCLGPILDGGWVGADVARWEHGIEFH
jgi:hypothetical protein